MYNKYIILIIIIIEVCFCSTFSWTFSTKGSDYSQCKEDDFTQSSSIITNDNPCENDFLFKNYGGVHSNIFNYTGVCNDCNNCSFNTTIINYEGARFCVLKNEFFYYISDTQNTSLIGNIINNGVMINTFDLYINSKSTKNTFMISTSIIPKKIDVNVIDVRNQIKNEYTISNINNLHVSFFENQNISTKVIIKGYNSELN